MKTVITMQDIKIIFMGTPEFAVPILDALIKNYNVIGVVSQPDREKNRKGLLLPTPTKKLALENGIDVFQPEKIKNDYQWIIDKNPDLIITCAYGQIVPHILLEYPKYKAINVHGSLLPKYRGGAPIHHAIINGDRKTGITIMYMSDKMDAGDIISQRTMPIGQDDTLDIIYPKMSLLGRDLLIDTLPNIINGSINPQKQNENEVTFGYNITKEEEKINFNNQAIVIHNQIRGLSSTPGAYCYLFDNRLKIYKSKVLLTKATKKPGTIEKITKTSIIVATIDFQLEITDIQLSGKKRCLVKDYLNGINKDDLVNQILT